VSQRRAPWPVRTGHAPLTCGFTRPRGGPGRDTPRRLRLAPSRRTVHHI